MKQEVRKVFRPGPSIEASPDSPDSTAGARAVDGKAGEPDRSCKERGVSQSIAATSPFNDIDPLSLEGWHRLTDEYAAALDEMKKGVPTARGKVQEIYVRMQHMMRTNTHCAWPRFRDPGVY